MEDGMQDEMSVGMDNVDVEYCRDEMPQHLRDYLKARRNALLMELRAIEQALGMDCTMTAREVAKRFRSVNDGV